MQRFGPVSMCMVDFDASAARILPANDASYFLMGDPARPYTYTGHDGRFVMNLRGGGISAVPVTVSGDGMPIRSRVIASFDQNADLIVNGMDETIVAAKLGTSDGTADFDGDDVVTDADLAKVRAHRGHAAEMPTAMAHGSWGRIKVIYR